MTITNVWDLRAIADQARHTAETTKDEPTAADARIVEDVLRWIVGDAAATPELMRATNGAVND